MDHKDHVDLLSAGIPAPRGTEPVWLDIGSGTGAFTLALAELLGPGAHIYSVDRDRSALAIQEREMNRRFPGVKLQTIVADFTDLPDLPQLDGIVAANSLHFVRRERLTTVISGLKQCLAPNGRFIVVEYNTDTGNQWVPYPFSYASWVRIAAQAGFAHTKLLAHRPSRFLGEIYSALSV